jgi:hypothetical protein
MTFAKRLIRLLAMLMPFRLFRSAWHIFRRSNCYDIYRTFGAPEEIRTPDPRSPNDSQFRGFQDKGGV